MQTPKNLHLWAVFLLLIVGSVPSGEIRGAEERSAPSVTLKLLERRKKQQIAAARNARPSTDFNSRIASRKARLDSSTRSSMTRAKTYKAAHYDHGNGLAVADVDGDGLLDIYFTTQLGTNQLWRNLGQGRFEDIGPERPAWG